MHEPSDYWTASADRLRELGAEPVLIGGLAARFHRRTERFTNDVDFLVDADLATVADGLAADGYEIKLIADPGSSKAHALFVAGKGHRIDVLRSETSFQREVLERAVDGVATAEDIIVFKLLAWRSRDKDDIRSILEAGHDLDEAYIAGWADAWQVTARWAEAGTWRS